VKLANSFSLYTAGLLSTLDDLSIGNIKTTLQFVPSPDVLELSHFDDFHIKLTLAALHGKRTAAPVMNGHSAIVSVILINQKSGDFQKKLEEYLEAVAPTLFDREQSHFMKISLKLAAELNVTKKDKLLGKTLDLWAATQILSEVHWGWQIAIVQEGALHTYRALIDESNSPRSRELISGQLRGSVEKRAEGLSKFVVKHLEDRVRNSHNNGQFETFLIAIILLNCVERMSWLFRAWENGRSGVIWPLSKSLDTHTSEGDGFSDVLHKVLKFRTLIPRTNSRPGGGILHTFEKDKDETATKWFESISITQDFLEQSGSSTNQVSKCPQCLKNERNRGGTDKESRDKDRDDSVKQSGTRVGVEVH
jgi:hypothetical protein